MTETGFRVVSVGWVESALVDPATAPKQGDEGGPEAWLVFRPDIGPALRDLAVGAEVLVLTWLDRARRDVLLVHPRDDPAAPEHRAPAAGLDPHRRALQLSEQPARYRARARHA